MKRISTSEAAKILGVSRESVRVFATFRDYLKPMTNTGDWGRGVRMYFDQAEVEAFARGGAPAAKAYRESLEVKPKRRGRNMAGAK